MTNEVSVSAIVTNVDNNDTRVELTFTKLDGAKGTLRVARSMLAEEKRLKAALLDSGARLPGGSLADLLNATPQHRKLITRRTGWRGTSAFILPNGTIGDASVAFDPDALEISSSRVGRRHGTLEAWKKALRPACRRSTYATAFLGLAFAAPLAALLGVEETAVFHTHGPSGAGKTLLAKLVASVSGPALERDLASFNVTPAAIDDILSLGNGLLVPFNEMRLADAISAVTPKGLSAFGHIVTSGKGRTRSTYANRDADLAQRKWIAFALTNGESSLESRFGKVRDNGERARFIDVPVPPPRRGGIFDRYDPYEDAAKGAAKLAAKVEEAISLNYGEPFAVFIEHLLKDIPGARARFLAEQRKFVEHVAPGDSWERRFARKVAWMYAGGIEGVIAGTMPATRDLVRRCCIQLYKRARAEIATDDELAEEALLRLMRISESSKRFPTIEKGQRAPANYDKDCWGMQRSMPGSGKCLAIGSERLREWAGSDGAWVLLMDRLRKAGVHVRGKDKAGLTTIVEVLGAGRRRYVLLRVDALRSLREASV